MTSSDDEENRYQISLHAENLPNRRWFGRACPYAKIKITTGKRKGTVIGKTEPSNRTLSPDWTTILFLNFTNTEVTNLEVTIFDYRGENAEDQWLGEANFEATSVFQSPGRTQSQQIGRAENSKLFCHIEKSFQGPDRGQLHLHLRGLDMKNVEPGFFGLGRSDPFFEVAKKDADFSVAHVRWNTVYRSEHIDNHLNPLWKPTHIGLEELCYGKLDWPLKISVFDYEDNGKHRLIGEFETSAVDLQNLKAVKGNADREKAILLGTEDGYKTYGLLCVLKADVANE